MTTTQAESRCRQCGYSLGGGERLMGLCPRCLMAKVLDIRREVQAQMQRVRPWPEAPELPALNAALPALEVLELIGRGGMGLVYRARQKNLEREVALKILPTDRASEAAALARFAEEAKILGSLNHPNIVMALDAGQVDGWLYLVMELVPGPNLRQVLARQHTLKTTEALAIATQVSAALAYAHSRGVVHRDIKPENILLDPGKALAEGDLSALFAGGGKVRVADFGIARLLEQTEMTLTAPQQILGTLDYLPPESRRGGASAGPAADVYAVGVMLYEMMTGHTPAGNFPPPGKLAKIDARLDAVVMKALRSEARERYADGAALHRAIVGTSRRHIRPLIRGAVALVAAMLFLGIWLSSPKPPPVSEWIQRRENPQVESKAQTANDVRVLMPGDSVQALWGEQWLAATVVEREGRRVKIHFDGWSDSLDEWVGGDRLKW